MVIRSPTNAFMLLKTKRFLEFKILPDHAEQKPEDCTCLGLPLSLFLDFHVRVVQYKSIIVFVSLTYEHASYEVVLLFRVIVVIRKHVKLVVPVRTETTTTAYYEYIGCEFAAAISLCSIAGRAV